MTHTTPNYDEMGEFLNEIVKDHTKNRTHINTLPDSKKTGVTYCVFHQKECREILKKYSITVLLTSGTETNSNVECGSSIELINRGSY